MERSMVNHKKRFITGLKVLGTLLGVGAGMAVTWYLVGAVGLTSSGLEETLGAVLALVSAPLWLYLAGWAGQAWWGWK